jgi:hypothetical protein
MYERDARQETDDRGACGAGVMPDWTREDVLAVLSVIIGTIGMVPYVVAIFRRQTKPHIFTWFVWGLISAIVTLVQFSKAGGAGAWAMAVIAASCLGVAALACKYGERNITRGDWLAFMAALLAIPLWYFTSDPFWSVLLVSLIDAVAFYPTIRKSWVKPLEESVFNFVCGNIRFLLAIFALEHFSLTNVLYPLTVVVLNTGFITMVLWRRRILAPVIA